MSSFRVDESAESGNGDLIINQIPLDNTVPGVIAPTESDTDNIPADKLSPLLYGANFARNMMPDQNDCPSSAKNDEDIHYQILDFSNVAPQDAVKNRVASESSNTTDATFPDILFSSGSAPNPEQIHLHMEIGGEGSDHSLNVEPNSQTFLDRINRDILGGLPSTDKEADANVHNASIPLSSLGIIATEPLKMSPAANILANIVSVEHAKSSNLAQLYLDAEIHFRSSRIPSSTASKPLSLIPTNKVVLPDLFTPNCKESSTSTVRSAIEIGPQAVVLLSRLGAGKVDFDAGTKREASSNIIPNKIQKIQDGSIWEQGPQRSPVTACLDPMSTPQPAELTPEVEQSKIPEDSQKLMTNYAVDLSKGNEDSVWGFKNVPEPLKDGLTSFLCKSAKESKTYLKHVSAEEGYFKVSFNDLPSMNREELDNCHKSALIREKCIDGKMAMDVDLYKEDYCHQLNEKLTSVVDKMLEDSEKISGKFWIHELNFRLKTSLKEFNPPKYEFTAEDNTRVTFSNPKHYFAINNVVAKKLGINVQEYCVNGVPKFPCCLCVKRVRKVLAYAEKAVYQHYEAHHSLTSSTLCNVCHIVLSSKHNLKIHMRSKHQENAKKIPMSSHATASRTMVKQKEPSERGKKPINHPTASRSRRSSKKFGTGSGCEDAELK